MGKVVDIRDARKLADGEILDSDRHLAASQRQLIERGEAPLVLTISRGHFHAQRIIDETEMANSALPMKEVLGRITAASVREILFAEDKLLGLLSSPSFAAGHPPDEEP